MDQLIAFMITCQIKYLYTFVCALLQQLEARSLQMTEMLSAAPRTWRALNIYLLNECLCFIKSFSKQNQTNLYQGSFYK